MSHILNVLIPFGVRGAGFGLPSLFFRLSIPLNVNRVNPMHVLIFSQGKRPAQIWGTGCGAAMVRHMIIQRERRIDCDDGTQTRKWDLHE